MKSSKTRWLAQLCLSGQSSSSSRRLSCKSLTPLQSVFRLFGHSQFTSDYRYILFNGKRACFEHTVKCGIYFLILEKSKDLWSAKAQGRAGGNFTGVRSCCCLGVFVPQLGCTIPAEWLQLACPKQLLDLLSRSIALSLVTGINVGLQIFGCAVNEIQHVASCGADKEISMKKVVEAVVSDNTVIQTYERARMKSPKKSSSEAVLLLVTCYEILRPVQSLWI